MLRSINTSFDYRCFYLVNGCRRKRQATRNLLGQGWDNPRVLGVLGLWLVLAILLYLRYWVHVRGRQLALRPNREDSWLPGPDGDNLSALCF